MSSSQTEIAFITGAGRGIGRETALRLAAAGVPVFLMSRSAERLEEMRVLIQESGGVAHCYAGDVSNPANVKSAFALCADQLGSPSILINNAGLGHHVPIEAMLDQQWEETIAVNLSGVFYCVREAVPFMKTRGSGLIINMASIASKVGFPGFAAYCAAKAGLLGFSRALREEVRASRIRVSVVMPGGTDTEFWNHSGGDWDRNKMMLPADVADVICQIVKSPAHVQWEEVVLMPQGGVL